MKTKHLFWGVLFISIGAFILIDKFFYLNFTWEGIWKLWPVVLILWGISFLFTNPKAKMTIAALSAFFLAFAIFGTVKYGTYVFHDGMEFTYTDEPDHNDSSYSKSDYKASYDKKFQRSEFYFKAGAGSFVVRDTSTDLFFANSYGLNENYSLTSDDRGDHATINFEMKKTKFHLGGRNKLRNRVEMHFNTDPIWDMNFDVGAASMNFDFTPYKMNSVQINTGAASLNVKLGDKADETHLDIDAGASSINVQIPENAGCEIKADISLSSKEFNGFTKVSEKLYRTDNFYSSGKKIYMTINSGVSSVKVSRYSGAGW